MSSGTPFERLLSGCESVISALYGRCVADAPNFGVTEEAFRSSLVRSLEKFAAQGQNFPSPQEASAFLGAIHAEDLFLALACADGSERAWWEFDQNHRSYLERIARHLASSEVNAQEVVDSVYVELYGTRVVDGRRLSKFTTFSGRGSLRGWLRTVVWHGLVDLHRTSHEVSLDEMNENLGEGFVQNRSADAGGGGESEMLEEINRRRYFDATRDSLRSSFAGLEDHERLLLLYYHADGLKLREIAQMIGSPESPLRAAFRRKASAPDTEGRIHESTVMRWLERIYARVLKTFKSRLIETHGFRAEEIEACMEIAARDMTSDGILAGLRTEW